MLKSLGKGKQPLYVDYLQKASESSIHRHCQLVMLPQIAVFLLILEQREIAG